MRARFHVRGRRLGYFREGTHGLCDRPRTRQLLPETCELVRAVSDRPRCGPTASTVPPKSNWRERRPRPSGRCTWSSTGLTCPRGWPRTGGAADDRRRISRVACTPARGRSGSCADDHHWRHAVCAGRADRASRGGRGQRRGTAAAPRAGLLPGEPVPAGGTGRASRVAGARRAVVDLYAGVGFFSASLAASGRTAVTGSKAIGRVRRTCGRTRRRSVRRSRRSRWRWRRILATHPRRRRRPSSWTHREPACRGERRRRSPRRRRGR